MKPHCFGCSQQVAGKFINSGFNNSRKRKVATSREEVPHKTGGEFSRGRFEQKMSLRSVHTQEEAQEKKPDANFKSIACIIDVVKDD